MATLDDVATNQDILDIANAIRQVTRTTSSMSIPEMPERLLNIRVVEYAVVRVSLASSNVTVLGTYDTTIKHMFVATPKTSSDAALLSMAEAKVELAYNATTGVLSFQHNELVDSEVDIIVADLLLNPGLSSIGFMIVQGAGGGGSKPLPYSSSFSYDIGDIFTYQQSIGLTIVSHGPEAYNSSHNSLLATTSVLADAITGEAQAREQAVEVLRSAIQSESQARADADDVIDGNIETLSQGLQSAEQDIQELDTALDAEAQTREAADDALEAKIDAIEFPVTSVNNETGDVVLNATDIKLTTNQQTVQANIIRIDEEINRVDEAKLDKSTPTAEGTFLYKATTEGQGTVEAKNTPTASAIPQYDEYGNIKSSTPVESNDVVTKEYGDGRYAPITYVSNLYGSIYLGGQTVRLIDNKPTAGQYNFLSSISTNTEYNWNSPTVTFDRIIENAIDLDATNSLTFSLKYIARRNATISWGAKVQCSSDGQTWEDISTQQSYNAVTVQADAGTTTDITVFTDSIVGVKRLEVGSTLRILLYKKQESATSLTTDIYFGVMVDNAYVCTYAQFNFLSVTIDTTQIKDGSVTYQKLSENVQQTIDGKLDKVTVADGNVRTYTIEADGTQNYRRATPAATNNAMVLRDDNGRAKFNAPVDNLDAANKGYVDTGLDGKQGTIDNAHKLSSDLVDDTGHTNKFVTSAEKAQITTNKNNIASLDTSKADASTVNNHINDTSNPHQVTKSQVGLGNVENERQYSATNPPPYPVTSVAGKTGAVSLAKGDVGLGNVGNFKAVSTEASQGLTDTEKSNARANIGAGTSDFSGRYADLPDKPTIPTALSQLSTDANNQRVSSTEKNTWNNKQAQLVNQQNIKSINGQSLLGSGDLTVGGGGGKDLYSHSITLVNDDDEFFFFSFIDNHEEYTAQTFDLQMLYDLNDNLTIWWGVDDLSEVYGIFTVGDGFQGYSFIDGETAWRNIFSFSFHSDHARKLS